MPRRFEEALQEARQVDKLLAEGPGDEYLEEKFPFLGVPITVKEAFSLHGGFPPSPQPLACSTLGVGWPLRGTWGGNSVLLPICLPFADPSLAGMPNTSGLVNRRDVIATCDATVVSRLKQAGAIPLGVTNCSELCMWYESSNRVYGRTNNPYDLQRIVGGSSGEHAAPRGRGQNAQRKLLLLNAAFTRCRVPAELADIVRGGAGGDL